MPAIKPFAAITYRHVAGEDITPLVAPPYDVISPEGRATLAAEPHNVVAIDLPLGSAEPGAADNRYVNAGHLWRQWLSEGVLTTDESPAFYLLEQSYDHEGRHVVRRAFVAAVRLHDFADGVVLPHERTLPKAIDDRLNLTRACSANLSPVFGLFSDPEGETDALFAAAAELPLLLQATDTDGVLTRVHALRDPASMARLQQLMADRQVFIADGHHRYTTALAYRDERRAADGAALNADAASEYVLMALVNMDDPNLVVYPTHRLARAEGTFDAAAFLTRLAECFELEDIRGHAAKEALERSEQPAFIVRARGGEPLLARLRSGLDAADLIPGDAPAAWKRLDVAVLQELVLRPLLGIRTDERATLERLSFSKDAHDALGLSGDADVAIVMRATRLDQLREVALAGEVMPQKTTYFYPKLLTGLLFRSLD